MATALPPCPAALVSPSGAPRFGVWQGVVGNASFADLQAPFAKKLLQRKLVEKKWVYTLIATPELFLCLAIIDAGPLHSAFLSLFDRGEMKLLADANLVLPGLFAHISDQPSSLYASISAPGTKASIEKLGDGVRVHARIGETEVDLRLDSLAEPVPISTCADLGEGRFDFTQKRAGLSASGTIAHQGTLFKVEGGRAGLDFTHGYLRRETDWQWAFAMGEVDGKKLAFNLSDGFLQDGSENVIFWDGAPLAAGKVSFAFNPKDPRAPWVLRTLDDSLSIVFSAEGQRARNIWTPLASSRYVQPFGTFKGYVTDLDGERIAFDGLDGVTEDHSARW